MGKLLLGKLMLGKLVLLEVGSWGNCCWGNYDWGSCVREIPPKSAKRSIIQNVLTNDILDCLLSMLKSLPPLYFQLSVL